MSPGRWTRSLTRAEWRRLGWFAAAIVLLHVAGWALFFHYAHRCAPLAGAGLTAYLFGLRHAFDADHIAAIDNTTRKMLAQGRRPMGIGSSSRSATPASCSRWSRRSRSRPGRRTRASRRSSTTAGT